MTWGPNLRAEIVLEFRGHAEHERAAYWDVYDHHSVKQAQRTRAGTTELRSRYDRKRQKAETDARIEAARAAGDIRTVRRIEACRRAKQRKKAS